VLRAHFLEYIAPAVAAATLGVVGSFTVGHAERLSVLETENSTGLEVQKELVRKVDNLTRLIIRVDTKLEEREKYEQRTR
jgi:hypothetical protein